MKDYHILIGIFMILGFVLNIKISKKVSFLNNTCNLNKYKEFKIKRNKYIKIYNSKNDKTNKLVFDEYDENCIKALIMAREVAKNNNENEVLLKHLLVAIIKTDSHIIDHIFKYFNISLQHFINKFNTEIAKNNFKKIGQEPHDDNHIQPQQIELQKCSTENNDQEKKFINNIIDKKIKNEEYNNVVLNKLDKESTKDNNTELTSNENYESEKITDILSNYNNNNKMEKNDIDTESITHQNEEEKQNDEIFLVNNNSVKRNSQKELKLNKEIKFSENCKLVLQNAILEAKKKKKIIVNLTDILISMINIAQENKECDFVKYLNELNISLSDLKKQVNNYDENNLNSNLIHYSIIKNTIQNHGENNNEHQVGNKNLNHYSDKQNRNMPDQSNNIINNMNNEYINQEKYFKNNDDNNFTQNNKFISSIITKDCLIDMIQRAFEKRLDNFFGRKDEIKRIIEILGRKKKSNPLLIGEAGVGKTAIVEQLAYLILKNKVPYHLQNCKIFQLNLGNIVAGTKYRGEFEEKMKQILANISKDKKNILFIDEIHVIVGAGSGEGSLDASNILKPFLSSDNLQCIGTTTFQEYSKYIETDKALRRRFNCVNIKPLNSNETYKLLKKIKNSYEQYHNIYYTNEALKSIILLSDDYLPSLNFPDKAIDILDEAGSYQKIKYERYITKKLRNENNIKIDPIKVKENVNTNKTDHTINTTSNKIDNNSTNITSKIESNYLIDDLHMKYVTSDVIENIVSKKSSISFIKKNKKEEEKIQNLKEKLNKIIIGQEKVIDILSKYLFKAITNIKDANKPIGTLLLCGSSGVGKTLCAQVISQYLFNDDNIIVINMSEYIDKHSVSKLFGSYPGYVGYKEGGELTESVKKKPFSIILFDEIEKAHSDVLHVLLQILDNGLLTDSKGNKVSFKNTFIFMTTNVGSDIITDYFKVYNKNYANFGFKYYTQKDKIEKAELQNPTNSNTHNDKDKIQTDLDIFEEKIKTNKWYDELQPEIEEELKKKFLPEFLNRIDEKILFRQFLKRDIIQILENMIEDLKKRIKKRKKLNILIDDNIIKYICSDENNIYDINFGARSIRRALYKYIEDPIAAFLISNEYDPNDTIHLTLLPNNKIHVKLLKHTITSLS
ncbi:ATP-dependent Clp protease, putative [Plasmodium berghei]|uniref:ATP-dependent Clp protease regulatory subunit ClpC, putative n=2 Tax=Plasmodium berghei TaxID=5821 RepID=A0A509ANF0_PLABA|nr:ATP-dependent Clp protease regulatory subunit ClpC, putative [Plasmodium berghei ANKA]CXI56283.1 ATP-dependent Clp protease, putative [Plasmodium berghei]SCL95333.1 ATP-dependent Clp protease, putative [Plasmodium berghei]SCM16231.1 ATP-dependent Clp protease, putative [Plasmodium berghei]SCM18027.1 ATP-dependent Clp protease, putative [Plasmodium berghei]VUC56353.1 ATP-dependent Clp protease regulatory subunit ClpC, putative [Plasmodium berghei ANKA]|eukprot:XP_034422155.1 ATP-dependent Clp protease regulatory subunit ClpC, putative [Plasmodium berghei ANKA]